MHHTTKFFKIKKTRNDSPFSHFLCTPWDECNTSKVWGINKVYYGQCVEGE